MNCWTFLPEILASEDKATINKASFLAPCFLTTLTHKFRLHFGSPFRPYFKRSTGTHWRSVSSLRRILFRKTILLVSLRAFTFFLRFRLKEKVQKSRNLLSARLWPFGGILSRAGVDFPAKVVNSNKMDMRRSLPAFWLFAVQGLGLLRRPSFP